LSYGTVTDIEGNAYKTIQIRNQVWMAENLKTTKYNDNTPIPLVEENEAWENLITPGYCWYNNDETTYKDIYGALYNWYAVNTGKLCPQGWHVPTDLEWHDLILYVDPNAVLSYIESLIAVDKIKETGTTHWTTDTGATNPYGFTALPSGNRAEYSDFQFVGDQANWWSTTEYDATHPYYRLTYVNESGFVRHYDWLKTYGLSVRCLKNP
jgi:uncharacterized protein (TIGR02145 family)